MATIDAKAVKRDAIGTWTDVDENEVYTRVVKGTYLWSADAVMRTLMAFKLLGDVDSLINDASSKTKKQLSVQKQPFAIKFGETPEDAKKVVSIVWDYDKSTNPRNSPRKGGGLDSALLRKGKRFHSMLQVAATKTKGQEFSEAPPMLFTVVFYHPSTTREVPPPDQNPEFGYYARWNIFRAILTVAIRMYHSNPDNIQVIFHTQLPNVKVRSVPNVEAIISPNTFVQAVTLSAKCAQCAAPAKYTCSRCDHGPYCGKACQARAYTGGNYCCGEEDSLKK